MGMTDLEIARRVIFSFISALCIIGIFSNVIGERRKKLWFKARSQISFFNRRGYFGKAFLFGRPITKEGVEIAIAMYGCIALVTFIIFMI
ncbi:MAG: hypothetical protein ACI4OA_03880 [Selenomonadaceae bacterium]